MVNKIKQLLSKIRISRTVVIAVVFVVMAAVLIQKLFQLQVIDGADYAAQFNTMTTKTRAIKSTRGIIYDRNGNILASNKLSYSLTLEDNGTYDTNREKNLTLNGVAYKILQILDSNGDSLDRNFNVVINDQGEYSYDVTGTTLQRFKADIYGYALIDGMKEEEANSTAEEMMAYLTGSERFCIILQGDNAYTAEELAAYGLPRELTQQEILDIAIIRYQLSTNSFTKYMPVTIATDVSDETVAAIMEQKDELQGADITEDSVRVYEEGLYFANLIGYTGKASTEELEELREENEDYDNNSVVGKTGIEQTMETTLKGTDGEETVYVDRLGKVLSIDQNSVVTPKAGNDVHLTIDKNLQIACYKILEQRIAGILISHIQDSREFDYENITDASQIMVPIYDVYNALVSNNVIDISAFEDADASDLEKSLLDRFLQKQSEAFDRIRTELTGDTLTPYKDLDEEMQEYLSYVVNDLLTSKLGILSSDSIDTADATYKAWNEEGSISLQEYLTYAAAQNWVDLSQLSTEGDYLDSREIYSALADYIADYLITDTSFSKLLYKYMIMADTISGQELCLVLYEQGVLPTDDGMYENLASGQTSAYNFMITKISNLEITPGQLALDPCSGSMVITNPNTGELLACVTYPGYDNNRLANNMDVDYYNQLVTDASQPFYNKATQQRTAPGSTFKLASAIAGLDSGIITEDTYINCDGNFDLVGYDINCWNKQGHGELDIRGAIEQSCNVFFNTVGFKAGQAEGSDDYSETRSLQVLQTYASMLDLDKKTGIEIDEAQPQVSDSSAVPSYMGQGTHLYTTVGLARYVSTIANSGTSYNLSLISKTTDSNGEVLEDYTSKISSQLDIDSSIWSAVHEGMQRVIGTHDEFKDIDMAFAGKTGTAQESTVRPDHGLFVGYAPYDDPQIAMAVRIPYGYSSGNACLVAHDVLQYVFDLEDKDKIITGVASSTSSNTSLD